MAYIGRRLPTLPVLAYHMRYDASGTADLTVQAVRTVEYLIPYTTSYFLLLRTK